jgi:lysophospholipase L1-like esterase
MNLLSLLPLSAFLIGESHTHLRQMLCLGDSYTIGEGVQESERWPSQLVEQLKRYGYRFAPPDVVAKTGWTGDELMRGMRESMDLLPHYDLVTLQIGVNNQYRARSLTSFEREISDATRQAIRFAGMRPTRVLLLSIPDWGRTAFSQTQVRTGAQIAEEIDQFNELIRDTAWNYGTSYVDVTGISKLLGEHTVADQLHPNAHAYGRWLEKILPAALQALEPCKALPDVVPP